MITDPPQRSHVFIVDGTLSRLEEHCQTNAARLFHLLQEIAPSRQDTRYHPGVQGTGWRRWTRAALGIGINDAIRAGYASLSSRYRPGDRIFLFGYSRGAYAVRSLAGLIERVGLLRQDTATERRVERAMRFYQAETISDAAAAFRVKFCHADVRIACVGVWDTVKALGLPYPVLARVFPMATEFHDHHLATCVDAAFHALAIDEDRVAFEPILWDETDEWDGRLEQMWFPGSHGDVGGERGCDAAALPLSNISLAWMIERARDCGLRLPPDWRARLPCDAAAPSVGTRSGSSRLFLSRRPRQVTLGLDGQRLHPSIAERTARVPGYVPVALMPDHRDDSTSPPPDVTPELRQ